MLDRLNLVFASREGGGNNQGEWLRTAQALDATATLYQELQVKPERIIIGGFSGGGYMSFWIQTLYPKVFRATLDQGRDFPLSDVIDGSLKYEAAMPFLEKSVWMRVANGKNRWAILLGTEDPNRPVSSPSARNGRNRGWTSACSRFPP